MKAEPAGPAFISNTTFLYILLLNNCRYPLQRESLVLIQSTPTGLVSDDSDNPGVHRSWTNTFVAICSLRPPFAMSYPDQIYSLLPNTYPYSYRSLSRKPLRRDLR